MTDKKAEAPRASEPKESMSKAEENRLAEFHRTHRVPSGYSYNVRDGLHKTPKKGK